MGEDNPVVALFSTLSLPVAEATMLLSASGPQSPWDGAPCLRLSGRPLMERDLRLMLKLPSNLWLSQPCWEIWEWMRQAKWTDDVPIWDQEFLKADWGTFCELILAANYLEIQSLLDVTCKTVASTIRGETPEEICKNCHIQTDFSWRKGSPGTQREAVVWKVKCCAWPWNTLGIVPKTSCAALFVIVSIRPTVDKWSSKSVVWAE